MKLKRIREEKGWSRAELARRSGVNASTIGQIEAGRFTPYPTQLAKLAKALGVAEREAAGLVKPRAATWLSSTSSRLNRRRSSRPASNRPRNGVRGCPVRTTSKHSCGSTCACAD